MIDPEKLNSLPSRSLLPRPEDVSHVATIGVRVAVDRQLVAGDVVGWYLGDEPDSWTLFDPEKPQDRRSPCGFLWTCD